MSRMKIKHTAYEDMDFWKEKNKGMGNDVYHEHSQ